MLEAPHSKVTMKFFTIALGIAALYTASANAATVADTNLEVREVNADDIPALMAREGPEKRC
ncbi:hypothetical protein F5X68DRAFT_238017 [Plectosphaerella plurivora]|uniref:Uncharacterized protein n=1 Tax=Plectosphaerella plurivora TaxID=936078 RepID=A0A9P8UQG1_9PEZI|nr:hypothetical protein F5X68DRAFT_238017 [Plectosphaerella plurivora]